MYQEIKNQIKETKPKLESFAQEALSKTKDLFEAVNKYDEKLKLDVKSLFSVTDFSKMTKKELYTKAQEKEIHGRGSMNKEELINALERSSLYN